MVVPRPNRGVPRRALLLLLASLLAVLLLATTGAPAARAAPITAPACIDDGGLVVPEASRQLDDAKQAQLRAGKAVPLYDNSGFNGSSVPFCTTRLVDGELRSAWSFCTDRQRAACFGRGQLSPQTGSRRLQADELGREKEQVISYLALHGYVVRDPRALGVSELAAGTSAGLADRMQRFAIQRLIWCISETAGVRTSGTAACRGNFDDDDFRTVLSRAPARPILAVTREGAGDVAPGDVVRFRVTTNLVGQPIALHWNAAARGIAVCEGDAALRDGTLTIGDGAAPGSIVLCLTADEGEMELDVQATPPTRERLVWYWNGDDNCQVFAHFDAAPEATLDATVRARSVRQTPPTPPVPPTPPTPTVPPSPADIPPTTPEAPPVVPVPPTVVPPAGPAPTIDRLRLQKQRLGRPTPAAAGTRVRWRLRVTNPARRITVRQVTVCDTLPAGVTFVRGTRGSRLRDGRRCWTIASLAPGASRTFTITGRILRGSPSRVVNRATATSIDARRVVRASSAVPVRPRAPRPGGVTG